MHTGSRPNEFYFRPEVSHGQIELLRMPNSVRLPLSLSRPAWP